MTTATRTAANKLAGGGNPPAEAALLKALSAQPDASAADLAATTGLGRSTAGKALARLEQTDKVRRTDGGRQGGRRLPDRWTLASEAAPNGSTDAGSALSAKDKGRAPGGERLKPGQLDELILDHLRKNPAEAVGPSAVAKALDRSSGAVGNALVRLARDEKVHEVSDKPRRYRLAA